MSASSTVPVVGFDRRLVESRLGTSGKWWRRV
jgi:hypothetical protein